MIAAERHEKKLKHVNNMASKQIDVNSNLVSQLSIELKMVPQKPNTKEQLELELEATVDEIEDRLNTVREESKIKFY